MIFIMLLYNILRDYIAVILRASHIAHFILSILAAALLNSRSWPLYLNIPRAGVILSLGR